MPTLIEVITKVRSFTELPVGWHFGGGVPASPQMMERAIMLVRFAAASGIKRANAFPGVDGEIQVTFYHEDSMLELSLELDGSITIAQDEGKSQIHFKEFAGITDALTILTEFSQKVWESSESSTESTMIRNVRTSLVKLLTSPAMSRSQWSTGTVRSKPVERFAVILPCSIVTSLATLPFTGLFAMESFRQAAGLSRLEVPLGTTATTTSIGRESKPVEPLLH